MSKLKVEETVTRTYRATERLYQNRDKSALVAEDDPEASFLFAAPGSEVSEEDARKYGLLESDEGEAEGEAKADESAAEQPAQSADEGRTEVKREEEPERVVSSPPKQPAPKKAAATKASRKK